MAVATPDAAGRVIVAQAVSTASGPAPGQSAKPFAGTQAVVGSQIIIPLWTVTAGKVGFLTDVFLYCDATTLQAFQIRSGGVPVWRGRARDISPIQLSGIETSPPLNAGLAVDLVVPAFTGNVDYDIFAFEQ